MSEYGFLDKKKGIWELSQNTIKKGYCRKDVKGKKYRITPSGEKEIWKIFNDYGLKNLDVEHYIEKEYKDYKIKEIDFYSNIGAKLYSIVEIVVHYLNGYKKNKEKPDYFKAEKQMLNILCRIGVLKEVNNKYITSDNEEYCINDGGFHKNKNVFTKYCRDVVSIMAKEEFYKQLEESYNKSIISLTTNLLL